MKATTTSIRPRSLPPARLRILVADDERDVVLSLMMMLRDEGHEVHGVHNPEEILSAVQRLLPDVVILDIAMPGPGGFQIAREIRAAVAGVKKPLLVAISGVYTRAPDILLSRSVGFDHHLTKPFDRRILTETLRPLMLDAGASDAGV